MISEITLIENKPIKRKRETHRAPDTNKSGFTQCEDHMVSLGHCVGAYKRKDG